VNIVYSLVRGILIGWDRNNLPIWSRVNPGAETTAPTFDNATQFDRVLTGEWQLVPARLTRIPATAIDIATGLVDRGLMIEKRA